MIDAKAKDILYQIKNINRFKMIIKNLEDSLLDIQREIYRIQEPSCPNGGDGVKIENHPDKYFIVNDLISQEMQLIQEKNEYQTRVDKAEAYLKAVRFICDQKELEFVTDFFDGMYYKSLSIKYGYENPYEKVLSLIKKSEKF